MNGRNAILTTLALATLSLASEGDLLLEVGAAPVARTLSHYAAPSIGTQISILSGFNEKTDLGLVASFDHMKGEHDGPDLEISTLAIQSWLTGFSGDIRPQLGGAAGVSFDSETNASFHLAGRARAIIELSTKFRLYAGAAVGGDIGDHGSMFSRGEFGAQFLVR